MSSGFEGTRGRATVSVAQQFVEDEGGTLAVSFPGWHHAIEVYAHAADSSMAIGEANAGLVAEAFNTLDEIGLTPRQLAEQRAELLEALRLFVEHAEQVDVGGGDAVVTTCESLQSARTAIANATQQRNATGGEG